MKKLLCFLFVSLSLLVNAATDGERAVISLNGTWQFDQTINSFPPKKFTRTIPVPGLVHLATPKIEEYDKFFKREESVEAKEQHNLYNIDYTPRYSWYRKTVFIPAELEGKNGIITIKKSQYVTQVYINGMDMGTSMSCYTPIEFPISRAIKFGSENEILIKVGDRVWLPSEAAGGTDKEKEHYLPGIWDDVELSFTGNVRVNRLLALPSVKNRNITIKAQIRNFKPAQIFYGDAMSDSINLSISIAEKLSGKIVANKEIRVNTKRDNLSEAVIDIPMDEFTNWSVDNPFLYKAKVTLTSNGDISDEISKQFGMRDFTRKGKFFYLNDEKIILRGTNITLQRFFEDPDCSNLVWDREWVRKLLVDYPKQLNWNMMRICVGIVPDFWYDIADENGLLFQNEWLYWQNHGWDDQIRKEYTDWVWTDGCHPSIAIWDAINENWDDYIGNTLIPELKKMDNTRVWDSGYMTAEQMQNDEMDEPHPYQGVISWIQPGANRNVYPLGNLDFKPESLVEIQQSGSAQLVNEYGWIWLWRNGIPSKLTVETFEYYLGENSTPTQNWEFQAYWMQLETEWLRSEPALAGVLAFSYLTNNYGYTGDWFEGNIKELRPTETLAWLQHAFAPAATFINLTDERYMHIVEPHVPGSTLLFNLTGINNFTMPINGTVKVKFLNEHGETAINQNFQVKLESFQRTDFPVSINLPKEAGGYVLVAEFTSENGQPVISRRFIKVGQADKYNYYKLNTELK
ncbi:sugar-binding domain-containing protein [Sunxiuqinia sp. A32]|uniref:sugar-binding domain-containing protein n=1 Tax=Sunxiuqinia sp. A32 TaxID=3461496 RepID=UPI004046044A